MNRIDNILLRARDTLADPTGSRWSDERLLRLIDEAQLDICRRAQLLRSRVLIPMSNGIAQVELPLDMLALDRVTYKGEKFPLTSHMELDHCHGGWENHEGSPNSLVYDKQSKFTAKIYPIPTGIPYNYVFNTIPEFKFELPDNIHYIVDDFGFSTVGTEQEPVEYSLVDDFGLLTVVTSLNATYSTNDFGVLATGTSDAVGGANYVLDDFGVATAAESTPMLPEDDVGVITQVSPDGEAVYPIDCFGIVVSVDATTYLIEGVRYHLFEIISEDNEYIMNGDFGVLATATIAYTLDDLVAEEPLEVLETVKCTDILADPDIEEIQYTIADFGAVSRVTSDAAVYVVDDYGFMFMGVEITTDRIIDPPIHDNGLGLVVDMDGADQNSVYGPLAGLGFDGPHQLLVDETGFTTGIRDDGILTAYYLRKPSTVDSLDSELEIDTNYDAAIKYYITGKALRDDMDTQNRTVGNEELVFYDRELQEALIDDQKDFTRNNTIHKTNYQKGI